MSDLKISDPVTGETQTYIFDGSKWKRIVMKTKKYRKKPVVIEAVQWDGENFSDVNDFLQNNDYPTHVWEDGGIIISTLEGHMTAMVGDWIIRGIQGEFYPCKPDIFEATYELV